VLRGVKQDVCGRAEALLKKGEVRKMVFGWHTYWASPREMA
jgi:hypothetical protein